MPSNYKQIRENNITEYGEGTRHLAFLGRLYTDRTHFIFEILQNAEDAEATKILFELFEDRLEVKHNGRRFNDLDVRGVCGVGEGTKAEDLTRIGKFGIGFKSVYAYTSAPEVHSGFEHFRIEHYVRPFKVAEKICNDTWTTFFVFPFDKEDPKPSTSKNEIAERLRNLSARTLLFLRNIKEIEYKLPDESDGVYLREKDSRGQARQITVIGQNNGQDEEERWLIFERTLPVLDGVKRVRVEIGFRLEFNSKEQTEGIIRINESPLVVFFPTEKSTRFGFLIQGPYRTTPSRDNIPKDDIWNSKLIKETAILLVDALQSLKEMGLLTVSLLNALPIRMDDFPEDGMFHPIVEAVRDALLNQELLPTDGEFVSARKAKLARGAELRKLITHDQLRELFQSDGDIKWLSGEITQDRTPDLRSYLMSDLAVDEITPEGFAREISMAFLSSQTDEWFIAFYRYLSGQEALWRSPRWAGDPGGLLRRKPILRLQDNSQEIPFRSDGITNAYLPTPEGTDFPVVKREICKDKNALEFLKKLKIEEPDAVTEVREKIIPKYAQYSSSENNQHYPPVSCDKNMEDMKKILRAYSKAFDEKKEQLKEALQDTAFVRAENLALNKIEYKRPTNLYFRSDELLLYFYGNEDAWFVCSEYNSRFDSLFKDIGVHDKVDVKQTRPGWNQHVVITNSHGWHKRGLDGFDPDIGVDGLEYALSNPTCEKSSFIWNCIAIANADCIRGIVELSSRKTFEGSRKKEQISDKFGQFLISKRWLPDKQDDFHKPGELKLDDLPEYFEHDEKLADQLGMIKDEIMRIEKETGGKFIPKREYDEFKSWQAQQSGLEEVLATEADLSSSKIDYKGELEKSFNRSGETKIQDEATDGGKVKNPEHRREQSYERHRERLHDEPKQDERRKETTRTILEGSDEQVREYLFQWYGGKCQVCNKTFPERNGQPFFVANYIVPRKLARFVDNPANALCLCANHFAKWEHGAVEAENIQDQISAFKAEAESSGANTSPALRIKLCGKDCEIKYNEKHLLELQELLRASDSHD